MRFWEYLAEKWITLCFLFIGGLLTAVLFLAAGTDFGALAVQGGLFLLLVFGWLTTGWLAERRRIRTIQKLTEELPEKYLLGEVLPKPVGGTEKRYYEIMRIISGSAVGYAEQAKREKDEYCDYVESWIHEIKTPLTACSLILANGGDVRKLKRELKRADNLTESILYYARMRTADRDTRIRKCQAAEVIGEAVKSQMELLTAAGVSVEACGSLEVYTDEKALCFILKQLLINSGKYCPGCRVTIRAGEGRIIVEDNGTGIPEHEVRRVTERGFTGTNGRRLGGSTGMGLYLVGELCSRLGIGLEISSRQGEFTRIELLFS